MRTRERLRALVAIGVWLAGSSALIVAALRSDAGYWELVTLTLGGLAFGAVGLLLAIRTTLVTGWLFLTLQLFMAFDLGLIDTSATESLLLVAAILLTFPSGRLPSRRWVWAVWLLGVSGSIWLVFEVFRLLPEQGWEWIPGLAGPGIVMLASTARIFSDYRKSVGSTRQQLKWLAWVLIVGAAFLLVSLIPLPYLTEAHNLAGLVLIVGSPIAIGFAVTRYRLYEIDRIISRTVSYAIVVAILGAVVAGVAAAVSTQFDSPLIVAATTLAVAAAFNPLRRRVQNWVDRRFNRSKYDHERVVDQFTRTLREGFDMDGLVDGWVSVVDETMQPRHIGVWTRTS